MDRIRGNRATICDPKGKLNVNTKCTYNKNETKIPRDELITALNQKIAQYNKDLDEGKVIFEKPENKNAGKKGKKGGK